MNKNEEIRIDVLRLKHGQWSLGAKERFYFWEFLNLAKRFWIIFICIYLQHQNHIQILLVLFVVVTIYVLLIYFEPYDSEVMQKLEVYSCLALILTMYLQTYFITSEGQSFMENTFV